MDARAQFGVYFAILRKHLVLLGVSTVVVLAAGVSYVVRQAPVYRAAATLTIETPVRSVAAGRDYADLLAADQEELQTQVLLLKENRELARRALDRLAAEGVDLARGDYTDETLPARVKVEFLPGTRAVSFSLTGADPATLPRAVDVYAEVYKDWSETKSARVSELQEAELEAAYGAAEARLREAQRQLGELAAEHKELNLDSGENPAASALRALQASFPALEQDRDTAKAEKDGILAVLAGAGVEAREAPGAYRLAAADGREGPAVEERLSADERVAALPCVRDNSVVQRWSEAAASAEARDRKLAAEGYLETTREREEARREAAQARERLGRVIAGAVVQDLARLDAQVRHFDAQSARLEQLKGETSRINELLQRYRERDQEIDQHKRTVTAAFERLSGFRAAFLRDPEQVGTSAQATRRITIQTPARAAVQIAPKVPLVLGLTAFAAVAIGLGLVLLIEYLDDTIKSKEDFDRYVGLPFLGFIPRIEERDAPNPDLAATARSGSAVAESFRAVRTSILFSRGDKPVRTILVTSAGPGEGKTTVAANLAITLAQHRGPVLLVDADLRKPRVAKALGIENRAGLTNYLVGDCGLDAVVQKTAVEGLFAITSGPVPPNPAELLHGDRLAQLLEEALRTYDRVVIDSPPLIAVSDARVVARRVDGLYLVVSMGKTSWRLIQRSLESLAAIGLEAHGAILNNLEAPTGRYGYYYYRDYAYGKGYYGPKQAAES